MYFLLMCLGIGLWMAGHFFKRAAPDMRAGMGTAGKGVAAAIILGGLVLMVVGYRGAEFVNLWFPPAWTVHLNNLLMLAAVFVYGMSATKGRLRGRLRHPQLIAVKIWAVSHLLVNGDLASVVLFGGLLAWAVLEVIVINRTEDWVRPEPGPAKKDAVLVAITVVMFGAITWIHNWLGVWPFPV
jgi:uncharacterized membrane protein